MPKVSVVIPTYNQAHFLGKVTQSARAQTFDDSELSWGNWYEDCVYCQSISKVVGGIHP